jgi:hypothetical protein
MLAYLNSDRDPDDYDFNTQDGKNFFAMKSYYVLSLLQGDAKRTQFLIDALKR